MQSAPLTGGGGAPYLGGNDMRLPLPLAAAFIATLAPQARAADQVKLGFLASLSGPLALVGTEMQRGLDLALDKLDHKLGGVPVKLSIGDDKAQPSEGVQAASKLIDDDKIDIVTGENASNVILATIPAFVDAQVIYVGALGGPAKYAGKECDPDVFVTTFQNDDWDMVMGKYMN